MSRRSAQIILLLAIAPFSWLACSGRAAYDAGYRRGQQQGTAQAGLQGFGIPSDSGLRDMAKGHCQLIDLKGSSQCEAGFAAGFGDGFRAAKATVLARDYEPLSWANLKSGALLFDSYELQIATVVSIDQPAGQITVQDVKRGTPETKQLAEVASRWYVRKPSPR